MRQAVEAGNIETGKAMRSRKKQSGQRAGRQQGHRCRRSRLADRRGMLGVKR